jgi:hypothetical protein
MSADDVAEAASGHGWVPMVADLGGVADKPTLLARLGAAGRFPGWVGPNWDALDDALGDLSWLGPADGWLLVLVGWDRFVAADPADAELVDAILADAATAWADRGTPFVALVSEG